MRAVLISLAVLGVTALLQAAVVVLSGSVALLADTVHNLSDALTAVPLWIAFSLARRPASRRFTYGLGRVEDLAGLVRRPHDRRIGRGRRVGEHPQDHRSAPVEPPLGRRRRPASSASSATRSSPSTGSGSAPGSARPPWSPTASTPRPTASPRSGVVVGAAGVALGYPVADPLVGLAHHRRDPRHPLSGAVRDVGRRLLDGVDPGIVDPSPSRCSADVPGVLDVPRVRLRWIGHRLRADAVLAVDPALGVGAGSRRRHRRGAAHHAGALPQPRRRHRARRAARGRRALTHPDHPPAPKSGASRP